MSKGLKKERGIKHYMKNPQTGEWARQRTSVIIESTPFSQGSFRAAYKARLVSDDGKTSQIYVAKFAMDPNTPRSVYYQDIEAEKVASYWASRFNKESGSLDSIRFIDSFVVELVDRPGRPICGMEEYIPGDFKKHNNNVGAVARNHEATPEEQKEIDLAQAFSHYTFERSSKQIMVCDIQGTPGNYTDPQIHTIDGKKYGEGNLGRAGIKAFLMRHKCNELCAHMGVPKTDVKTIESMLQLAESQAPEIQAKQKQIAERHKAQAKHRAATNTSNNNSTQSSSSQRKPAVSQQRNKPKSSSTRSEQSSSNSRLTAPTNSYKKNSQPSSSTTVSDDELEELDNLFSKDDEDLMASILGELKV